jgi:hypothetical protein
VRSADVKLRRARGFKSPLFIEAISQRAKSQIHGNKDLPRRVQLAKKLDCFKKTTMTDQQTTVTSDNSEPAVQTSTEIDSPGAALSFLVQMLGQANLRGAFSLAESARIHSAVMYLGSLGSEDVETDAAATDQ